LGRSRGGWTTKIHLACDGRGRPLSLRLTPGNVNDTTELERVLAGIKVAQPGPGRRAPVRTGVIADKGYSSKANRQMLARRGIKATIPERDDQLANRRRRRSAGGRPTGSTRVCTGCAMSSSGASTGSSSGGAWRPATTRPRPTT
jgi:transposase